MKNMLASNELEMLFHLLTNVGVANTLTAISQICAEKAEKGQSQAYWLAASEKTLEAAEEIREYA